MRSTLLTLAVSTLLAVGGISTPSLAQNGSMSMALLGGTNSFRPDLTQRDLKVIIRVLGLKGESLTALQNLYDGYAGTLASEGAAVREYVAEVIEKSEILQNVDLLKPANERIEQWNKRSEQIKKTFLDDLKSLLTREEESRWPIVERELRRIRHVSAGLLTGENVDLVRLTEDVVGEAGATGELAELLNRYSDELDHALVARKKAKDENTELYSKGLKEDPEQARKAWKAVNDARLAVQALNDRYARLIAAQVPPEKKQAFERAWFERCYPMVCRPTRLDEYLKDAQQLQSLTGEQKSQLKAIAGRYEERVWQHRQVAAKAWREFETEHRRVQLEEAITKDRTDRHNQYNGSWLPESHPINATRRERLEIDRDFRRQIDAVLTPEQRDEVPTRLTPFAKYESWQPNGL
ncbi:MAG TPA: hypothetical protein VD997_01535 [Phycisphaerales bacterium]|nr:hypothetical protein [Phycisphaerales bacterium]